MTDEHAHGEQIEDTIFDAQNPLSFDEVMRTINRVSREMHKALDDELSGQSRSDTDRLQHGSADADAAVDSE